MEKKKAGMLNASERDGVQYRKASFLQLIMGMSNNGTGVVFYLMIGFATMVGTQGFGIATLTVGGILTVCRVWDGITDPIIAVIYEKMNPKYGKIRIFMFLGWAICTLGLLLMYNICAGKVDGILGIVMFVISYLVYDIGYTLHGVGGGTIQTVITNDPTQRPMTSAIGTAYAYGIPIICTNLITFVVLPKYDNLYNLPMLAELCIWFAVISFILMVISCIGAWKVDVPETFERLAASEEEQKKKEEEKVTLKEMFAVLKDNREMQMHIITGVSDKLAQQTAAQSVITTLMNGVLIGSYVASTMVGNVSQIVSIAFAVFGGLLMGKWGAKKSTVIWSWISIIIAVATVGFCLVLGGPTGMKQIGVMGVPVIIYTLLTLGKTGSMMVLSTANGARGADVTDYEYMRSGNYMPAVVSATYSFIDKAVSSFGSLVATGCIALVGYVNTVPQMGDEATWPIFWMAMFLNFGMQIIGWIMNLIAMKFYSLDKEKMVEVQKVLAERRKTAEALETGGQAR